MATTFEPVGQTIFHCGILRKIGGGVMGVVYEAEDVKLGAGCNDSQREPSNSLMNFDWLNDLGFECAVSDFQPQASRFTRHVFKIVNLTRKDLLFGIFHES